MSADQSREPAEPRFAPNCPVVIFETNRIEQDSEDLATDEQLKGYMLRERCREGFIFNGRQAAWQSLAGELTAPVWTKAPISDLSEAEPRSNEAADRVAAHVVECEAAFARAAKGEFDAPTTLVAEFGSAGGLTFSLSVRNADQLFPMRAFNQKVASSEWIAFRARDAGRKYRQELTPRNFPSLASIELLTG